jgi:AraC-like DNA-binding protein
MHSRARLGFLGPLSVLTNPHDGPCAVENARLAAAISELGPLWLGDLKVRIDILHLSSPPPKAAARYHVHSLLEISYMVDGAIDYRIQKKTVRVPKGGICCIPPEMLHGWNNRSRTSTVLGFLLAVSPTSDHPDSLGLRLSESAAKMGFRITPTAELKRALEALRKEIQLENPFHREAAKAYITLILSLVFRALATTLPRTHDPVGAGPRNKQSFLQARAYIEANLAFNVSLADVARHMGISARHVNRIFRTRQGISVGQFISHRRLELAKKLLRERRDASIKNIALLCGFKDVSYFCRFFRKATGASPTTYEF